MKSKRFISWLLTAMLIVSLVPALAFAESGENAGGVPEESVKSEAEAQAESISFKVGDPGTEYEDGSGYTGHDLILDEESGSLNLWFGENDELTINNVKYTFGTGLTDQGGAAYGWFDEDGKLAFGDESGYMNNSVYANAYLNDPPKSYDPKKFYDFTVCVGLYDETAKDWKEYKITTSENTDEQLACRISWGSIADTTIDNVYYYVDYETKSAVAESTGEYDDEGEMSVFYEPGKVLDYVTVPAGRFPVTSVHFYGNKNLKSITLPETVNTLSSEALSNTGLTSITIPSTVKVIEDYAVGFNTSIGGFDSEGKLIINHEAVPGFVIYGKTGSAAQDYAKRSGIKFVDKDAATTAPQTIDPTAAAEAARQGVYNAKLPKVTAAKPVAAKKAITVKWKKLSKKNQKKVQKIEVWVCPNKAFGAGDTIIKTVGKKKASVKVKGLKAKTKYYVKVRSIKYAGGVKQVGKWSKVKKVKTK